MKTHSLFLFALFGFINLTAQTDQPASERLNHFVNHIETFNRLVPQEKVYLHFDNTNYMIGETIWFKAYITTAGRHVATKQSGVLYVELLSQRGKLLETKKLKITDGQCTGDFLLYDNDAFYNPGFYEVRAYTQMMLNFGEETVFSRVFPVFDLLSRETNYTKDDLKEGELLVSQKKVRKDYDKKKKLNVAFYPEGGQLINYLASHVAFQATDENGKPVAVKGILRSKQKETLGEMESLHDGMGIFSYIPTPGSKEEVVFTYQNKDYTFSLPAPLSEGYVMSVNNLSPQHLMLRIEKSAGQPVDSLGLSIMCGGNVLYFQTLTINNEPYELRVPKTMLLSGVNQLTLFDPKGNIYAERLAFVYPPEEESVRIEASFDKEIARPMEESSVSLQVISEEPASYSLSVAIRDAERMTTGANTDNIKTNLLLSSDLGGFINNPAYYFESQDAIHTRALDLLMMVQGWRRYNWPLYAGVTELKQQFKLERELTLKGSIPQKLANFAEMKLTLRTDTVADTGERIEGAVYTNKEGEFFFDLPDFYGKGRLYLRSRSVPEGAKQIRIDRWFSPKAKSYLPLQTEWSNFHDKHHPHNQALLTRLQQATDSAGMSFLIPEVNITRKVTKDIVFHIGQELDRRIDEGKNVKNEYLHDYLTGLDYRYTFEAFDQESIQAAVDTSRFPRMNIYDPYEYNATLTPGPVRVSASFVEKNPTVTNPGYLHGNFFWEKPHRVRFLHLFNGEWENFDVAVIKGSTWKDVSRRQYTALRPVMEVESVRVEREVSRDNRIGFEGKRSIPIYVTPYADTFARGSSGTRHTAFYGFARPSGEFYKPQEYTEEGLPDVSDHKRTLYWNPNLQTDESGKVTIRFKNNLFCRILNVSAEGITPSGTPMAVEKESL